MGAGRLAVPHHDVAVDHGIFVALRTGDQPRGVARKVLHHFLGLGRDRIWVEYRQVRGHARAQQAAAGDAEEAGRGRRQPAHGLFQTQRLPFSDPVAEQKAGIRDLTQKRDVRPAVRAASHHVGVGRQAAHRVRVAVLKAGDQELRVQIFRDRQVEHGFQRRLALGAGDGHQVLALQRTMRRVADMIHADVLHPLGKDFRRCVVEVALHGRTVGRVGQIGDLLRPAALDRRLPRRQILEHRPTQRKGEVETFTQR